MAQGQVTHTALCGVEIEIILSSKDGTFFEGTLFFYPAMILCFNHLNQPIWNPTPLIYWAFLMVIKYLHCQRPFPHHHESCTLEHSGALIVQKGTLTFIVKIIKDAFVSLFLIGGVGRDVGDRGGVWSQQVGFLAEWGLKTAVLSPVSRIRLDKDTPPPCGCRIPGSPPARTEMQPAPSAYRTLLSGMGLGMSKGRDDFSMYKDSVGQLWPQSGLGSRPRAIAPWRCRLGLSELLPHGVSKHVK